MSEMEAKLLIGFCVAGAISLPAWRFRALDRTGAIAALAMGTIIFGLGGMMPSVALVLFFVSGSILSALPGKTKVRTGDESLGRSWKQVAANGSIATLLILATAIFPTYRDRLLMIAVASIAAAAADSWSTEIGTRYGGTVRDILSWRRIPAGISGGVSFLGLLAAVCAGLLVASSTYLHEARIKVLLVITLSAFFGAVCDSILGSSVQAKYQCGVCRELVETPEHCGVPASLVKGAEWIDNNVVNFAATGISAIICTVVLDF
jgi:uncharacterized protein (TIGR00297 family)